MGIQTGPQNRPSCHVIDGRILVVEYKGDDYISNDDSKEKKNVGELWEERCPDKTALFIMAMRLDALGRNVDAQIKARIAKG
jgi:type III restriction enzyme